MTATETKGKANSGSTGRAKPLPHVEPEKFAAVRDRLKLRNRDLVAILGVSASRVTELTKTKGSTKRQYDDFVLKLKEAADKAKPERAKPSVAVGPGRPKAERHRRKAAEEQPAETIEAPPPEPEPAPPDEPSE